MPKTYYKKLSASHKRVTKRAKHEDKLGSGPKLDYRCVVCGYRQEWYCVLMHKYLSSGRICNGRNT